MTSARALLDRIGSGLLGAFRRRLALANRRRLQRRQLRRRLDYPTWCERYDQLTPALQQALRARWHDGGPLVALRLDLTNAGIASLRRSAESIGAQWYPHWRLFLAGSGGAEVQSWAQDFCAGDARVLRGEPARADWCADVAAGDVWREHALSMLVAAALGRDAQMVYADHDTLGADLVRRDACFKPDWNADWLLAGDWVCTPILWRQDQRPLPGHGPHDRLLRAAERLDAGRIHHVPHVLVHRPADAAPADADAPAVTAHLARQGETATAEATAQGVRVRFALPEPAPRVSIVIPTRNGLGLLRRCVETLRALTRYPDYEIVVVDNGSDDPACLAWLARASGLGQLRVRRDDGPFNFAALNNDALADCTGSVIAMVNNDIEVIDGDWLREMVSLALRPGVGAVGARLLYADRTLQHAGMVIGIQGGSGHVHRRLPAGAGGYMQRALQLQCLSAVTAACLVVQRRHFEAVGGMDAAAFPVTFNDTDLCLRLQAAGLRTLYTPHATLLHHESVSRGSDRDDGRRERFERAREVFAARWPRHLAHDPAYNPNLSLADEQFGLAEPPRIAIDAFEAAQ